MSPADLRESAPYTYTPRELVEPDWTRFPAWRTVTRKEWRDPVWQRNHSVRNPRQLRDAVGDGLADEVYEDLARDQATYATMPLLVSPHIINTMMPGAYPGAAGALTDAFLADPVRRYMLPLASDRLARPTSHPRARRDPLHEQEMWATEGLTHRYPAKVLLELTSTCPQYCGHCTRMDLVGPSVPQVVKTRFTVRPSERLSMTLKYIRSNPQVRDVVVSGGDVANVPWHRLEDLVAELLAIGHVRDVRLASKGLAGLPQHWLSDEVRSGLERLSRQARRRECGLAMHTHVNAAQSVTPLVAEASRAVLDTGLRDVRNQGVLLRGVNATGHALLDLCFALLDGAGVTPYYFYLCDLVPHAEHWRLTLGEAQRLQDSIMGWLPGFATPRLVCDVPRLGKRWVHQVTAYDTVRGISVWSPDGAGRLEASGDSFQYFDPVHLLPEAGRDWWEKEHPADDGAPADAEDRPHGTGESIGSAEGGRR
ncbi:KamA family radical SAM protein [Streptomyces tsukubensis]|uniref:KamA family radical SAM protein n=1 Tax=Streptomyces tsukubensis TaxID=83656 RepID=UPI0036CDB04B